MLRTKIFRKINSEISHITTIQRPLAGSRLYAILECLGREINDKKWIQILKKKNLID